MGVRYMFMDFTTFFDIYMRPRTGRRLKRDGIEFCYAATSLMIACSKSDMEEHPDERETVQDILKQAFGLSEGTVHRMLEFADNASEESYLGEITQLINQQFTPPGKRFILEKLWCVAYADGRIENREQAFIDRIATEINMSSEDVETARILAQHQRAP